MSELELETCQLLKSWGIEEPIIQNFTDNGIDLSHFKDLTNELLKELSPKISTRIFLKNKIDEYLTAENKTSTVTSVPSCSQNTETEINYISELESDFEENNILEMIGCRPAFPEFDLRTLLTTSPSGSSILKYYETNKQLTVKHRNTLTDIICRRIFTRVVNHRINHEEYNILTSKIIALFPTENAGTYFVPSVKKRDSISGKPGFAKGKLVDKIRNTLYKSGERKRKLNETENKDSIPSKRSKNLNELQDVHKEDVIWLKNNSEPWECVINKWKTTHELRQISAHETVGGLIENWPILNDVRSDVLIQLDFDAIHPGRANKFYINWNEFIKKIIEIKKTNTNEEVVALIEYINALDDNDKKLPSQIKLLCNLVPPKGRLNRRQKFSTTECVESFIVNVKSPGDIQSKIDEVSTDAYGKKKRYSRI